VRFLSATRLVILCRTREEALAALGIVRAWTDEAGLKLHPAKTHVGDCRLPGQGFEFLGYRFEAGRRLVRKKSLAKLKDSIRAKTARNRGDSLKVVIADLNPMLRELVRLLQASPSGDILRARRLHSSAPEVDVAEAEEEVPLRDRNPYQ
jgi:hypothetical protein